MGGESWLVSQSLLPLPTPARAKPSPSHTLLPLPRPCQLEVSLPVPVLPQLLLASQASGCLLHPLAPYAEPGKGRGGVSGPACSSARGRRLAGVSSDKKLAPPLPKEKLFGISTSLGPAIFRYHPFPSPPSLIPAEGGSDSPQTLAGRGSLSEPQADPAGCSPRVAPPGVTPKWPASLA